MKSRELTLDSFMQKESGIKELSKEIVETSPELPEGWDWVKLESVAFIRKGTIDPLDFPEEEFELYSIPAYHTSGKPELKKGKEIKSSKVVVYPGDCLFGKLNPKIQKVWLVGPNNNRRRIATTEFFPIVSREKSAGERWFLPEFMFFILKSPHIQERVVRKVLGTTASRQRLSPSDILEEKIPLPPLEEQKRIVSRIEKVLSRVKQAKKLREEALKEIEAVMQSALHRTFSTAEEEYGLKALSEVCEINPSKKEIRNLSESLEVTFIPMSAVSEVTGRIENPSIRFLKDVRKGYTYFKEGDVLFAKITPCMENGKSAIARNLVNGIGFGSTEFHVVRPSSEILAEWVHYFIRQKSFRELAARNMTGSVGQQRVPDDFLKSVRVPIPPISEQKCIVEYLDKLRKRIEGLKKYQEETKGEIEAVTQAVLKKAFGGGF